MKEPAVFSESICGCHTCINMCEQRPCWPTAEEGQTLIKAGYGPRLMLDYWVGGIDETECDIQMTAPAIVGFEGRTAPFWPTGRCTFLKDGLCELHDKGLKPLEGRVASCKDESSSTLVRLHIVRTWNTDLGRSIVNNWKRSKI